MLRKVMLTSNASSALCHTLITCGFVVSGDPAFSSAEQPSSASSFVLSGNPALLLLLLHVVFIVTGNPAFSLG